jgi:chromosome segregation ATPase
LNHHTLIVTMYPPTGGKEGDIGSTTGGTLADEIARHNEQVDTAGQRGKAGRKKRAEEANPDSLDMQILKDELAAAEKGLERSERELKKARELLAERTAELKSMKLSMTANNRARNEGEKEVHIMQKQVALLKKQMDLQKKQSEETVKAYNKVKESTRAKIAELEKEIAQYAPLVQDLERSADTLKNWSDRDSLLREG